MDSFKKHVFADQILSSRRKLLTRFSYGVGACFLILTGLFLCNSSKSPFSSSSLFQGFYSSHLNPSTGSWRFSFPTSSFSSSTNTKQPQITQGVNFSANAQIGEETTSDNAKVPNAEVPSFGVKQDGISDQTSIRANGSKNETLPVSDLGLDLLQKTRVGDSTQINSSKSVGDNPANNGSRTDFYGSLEDCDVYNGRWVKVDDDDTMPYYPPGSCPYIDKDFDCHLNGRPDDAYLKWRWQPSGCNIPRLNATDFLEKLRGKKLVFVGDSLNRNMWESLVCILRHSVKDKKRVYEISGRTEFKKKGFYAFRFEDYNCTVDFVGSPFLVRESIFKGKNRTFETLRLDLMDKTTSMYEDADILIFNTGHWWTHDKTKLGEDYYQEGNHVHGRLKVLEAYKRALTTWSKWVDQKINSRRQTHVIFRGYSATHFRGGPWNSGGQCHKETEPFNNTKYLAKYPSKMRALETVMKQMKTPVIYMNISRLTDFRKDSHPSVYRTVYRTEEEKAESVKHQDCSHWCLPGVPDVWNQLLYVSLLKAGFGSW